MRTIISIMLVTLLFGCSSINNPFAPRGVYSGITPPQIHTHDKNVELNSLQVEPGIKTDEIDTKVRRAEIQPYIDYFIALDNAKVASATTQQIKNYLQAGITVVNVSCLRWFQSLSNAEIRFNFAQANQNVIQDLGTTLLGLGKANPLTVGIYGAGFTALNGVEKAFSQSFFLAPNANKVKSHIFSALDKRAEEIIAQFKNLQDGTKESELKFTEAYLQVERYADICTQQTAKEIINSSLDQTKTQLKSDEGGRIETVMTLSARDAASAKEDVKLAIKKQSDDSIRKAEDKVTALTKSLDTEKRNKEILLNENETLKKSNEAVANQRLLDELKQRNRELSEELAKLKNN